MNRSKQYIATLAVALTLLSCSLSPRQQRPLAKDSGQTEVAEDNSNTDNNKADNNDDSHLADEVSSPGDASYTVPDSLLPLTKKGVPEQQLRRKAYVCSFNSITLMPNWVAWKLTAAHSDGNVQRKGV